jgi:hypothetical protein
MPPVASKADAVVATAIWNRRDDVGRLTGIAAFSKDPGSSEGCTQVRSVGAGTADARPPPRISKK